MGILKKKAEILERQVGEEYMLYDAVGRKVHVLNETAHFVWGLCDGTCDEAAVMVRASEAYGQPAEPLQADIEACLAELRELGLLETETV